MKHPWWQDARCVIQTNLQVKDTARIDPEKLAETLQQMGADVLVFNVGGIYAWYESKVPGHHVNEHLPRDRDLLQEVIQACHERGIRFVGRLDFSKASDEVYLARPDWFARSPDQTPQTIGAMRPGAWTLLYLTCMQSGYCQEGVAMPVLSEVVSRYDMDAVFFNAPFPNACWCDRCRRLYEDRYQESMPQDAADFPADWQTFQMQKNVKKLNAAIAAADPKLPTILYYWDDQLGLDDKLSPLICDESQNVLSRGRDKLSPAWLPSWNMKKCHLVNSEGPPFGIIHSSPGMEWRHTGLPAAEYEFWLSQIPAAGGSLWHSLTGVPKTIRDKKILSVARYVNSKIRQARPWMEKAREVHDLGLLWQPGMDVQGWLKALSDGQIPYALIRPETLSKNTLQKNAATIVPAGYPLDEKTIGLLSDYAHAGGRLIFEGALAESEKLQSLCGIQPGGVQSEPLRAAYLRVEDDGQFLAAGSIEGNRMLAMGGKVFHCRPQTAETLATLVPPFAPPEAVGAPPERASLPLERTDLPLAMRNTVGNGTVFYLPFELSNLIDAFGLSDHVELAINLMREAAGPPLFSFGNPPGVLLHHYETSTHHLLHVVNGIGTRPLSRIQPVRLTVSSRLSPIGRIEDVFAKTPLTPRVTQSGTAFELPLPDAWRLIAVEKA